MVFHDLVQIRAGQSEVVGTRPTRLEGRSLLVLDEPTDNLDIGCGKAAETALEGYEGTVICVTHDRWFMRQFDRFLMLNLDGSMQEYPGLESA